MTVLQNPPFLFVFLFAACHGSSTPPSVGHDGDLHGCKEQCGHAQGELRQVHALESIDPRSTRGNCLQLQLLPDLSLSTAAAVHCAAAAVQLLDSSSSTAAA